MKKHYFALVVTLFVLPIFAQNIPNFVPKDGLVGYWPFNGNTNDESGNGNDLNNNDGVTFSDDRLGNIESSAMFNGNQKLIRNSPTFFNQNSDRTISFWISQKNDISSSVSIININAGPGGEYCSTSSSIETFGNNNFYFWKRCDDLNWETKARQQNTWYNIVVVYSQNTIKLYINNELQEVKSFSSGVMNTIPSFFNVGGGMSSDGNNGFWDGKIDDIAIYNRALSEQEVKQLYGVSCPKETATSSSFNSLLLSTGSSVSISAEPQGGTFNGVAIENNQFIPNKAKIGLNKVQYNFKNSQGCNDSTLFSMIVADTVGAKCTKIDTITVKNNVYDTITVTKNVTKYDTVTVKNNVFDTVTITNNITKYDTVTVKKNVYDTVIVTKTVTKFDTVTFKNNIYDTIFVTKNVTKFDTITITNKVTAYDTVLVNKYDTINVTKYDTITFTNNITKYDTLKVTKFDTITVKNNIYDTVTITNNVTKYDTVIVNKYDTITVTNNVTKYDTITLTDTVSILKITFKLTTGIQANQMASMSLYPNPTTDVLHIEVGDAKALDGYRYRILDALGKEVYNELVKNAITEIPLKTLGAAGMYQFEVLDQKNVRIQTNKIVLQ